MTLTSKKEHEQDRENERNSHRKSCGYCGDYFTDHEGEPLYGRWFCSEACAEEHLEQLEYKSRKLRRIKEEVEGLDKDSEKHELVEAVAYIKNL